MDRQQQQQKPGRSVPHWDDYFMSIARAASIRSRDPDTQIGCVIAERGTNHIISTGYNGPPPGVADDELDWSRPAKYDLVIHAEANAILHATQADLSGCSLYVTGKPCSTCMRLIAAKRIARVYYSTSTAVRMVDDAEWQKTLWLAQMCLIQLHELKG